MYKTVISFVYLVTASLHLGIVNAQPSQMRFRRKKEVEIGATTVEKKQFNDVTPKLFDAEIIVNQ